MPRAIIADVIDVLILGQGDRRRQLQDFPILGDVWAALAGRPGDMHDLLIAPYHGTSAARVAGFVSAFTQRSERGQLPRMVSYLDDLVAARLTLGDICRVLIAGTGWWRSLVRRLGAEIDIVGPALDRLVAEQLLLEVSREPSPHGSPPPSAQAIEARFESRSNAARQLIRLGLVVGMLGAAERADDGAPIATLREAAEAFGVERIAAMGARSVAAIQDQYLHLLEVQSQSPDKPQTGIIYNVSANRPAEFAASRSVPAIKADAARRLFEISCSDLNWAVLDSGIDASHPAFVDRRPDERRPSSKASDVQANEEGLRHRIRATYDFGLIRRILNRGNAFNARARRELAVELAALEIGTEAANEEKLLLLADKLEKEEELDWKLIAPLIERKTHRTPSHPHGTHVAGILGGHWIDKDAHGVETTKLVGVCPDINLYDFRVLGADAEQTEFAVVAALQFVLYINRQGGAGVIHGVNLSLSIPHNVRNYACGRTPVCETAEKLVDNKVVVVAAAGNRGYQRYRLADGGLFESYAASSITDPGNAEKVITVGATHRFWPHTYGVSFFSSRGPTGDGRAKPDLLAPGERIESCVPDRGMDVMDGTSMAAPHVSGAAALLMARHREFRTDPASIKQYLCKNATDLGRERSFQGSGMVDVLRAIQDM